jgi:hypothetical protein
MKGKQVGFYPKASATPGQPATKVFVYEVTGTAEELSAYKKVQKNQPKGDMYRETTDGRKVPLWFTVRSAGAECTLKISQNGGVFADNTELENLQSLADQYPAMASAINAQMASILFRKASAPVAHVELKVEAPADLGK